MRTAPTWHALGQARLQRERRRPFVVDGLRVGSVAEAHLGALARWPQHLTVHAEAVVLLAPAAARDEAFEAMNEALRAEGLILAWRDERFPLLEPASRRVLAGLERASARFWGTLTLGAHCNGWVAGPDGKPQGLWLARRSATKATDPNKLDNLIGGGVPLGQTPWETVVREGFEEAGLGPERMAQASAHRVVELDRDVPEGRQFERLHVFDLELQPGEQPANQDGEVADCQCWPLDEALVAARSDEMTVDAALVTLEFALRRGLLTAEEEAAAARALQALLV